MKIKSKIEGSDEWLFIEEIPERYSPNTPLSEKNVNIKSLPAQKLVNYQLSAGGLFLVHSTMQFNTNVKVLSEIEGETITSQFIFLRNKSEFGKKGRQAAAQGGKSP